MSTIAHLVILTLTVLGAAHFIKGVRVTSVPAAIGVAVLFSVLNWLLGGIIQFVMFLPAILTLGLLFLVMPLIVNTILLWLTDKVLHVFEIEDAKALWLTSLLITVVNAVAHRLLS